MPKHWLYFTVTERAPALTWPIVTDTALPLLERCPGGTTFGDRVSLLTLPIRQAILFMGILMLSLLLQTYIYIFKFHFGCRIWTHFEMHSSKLWRLLVKTHHTGTEHLSADDKSELFGSRIIHEDIVVL